MAFIKKNVEKGGGKKKEMIMVEEGNHQNEGCEWLTSQNFIRSLCRPFAQL